MEKQKLWQKILLCTVGIAGTFLALRFLGPVLLPFAFGLVIALAAEPPVTRLQNRTAMPRWLCAGMGVTAVYVLITLIVFISCKLLWKELSSFVSALPSLLGTLAVPAASLEQRLLELAGRFPDGIGKALETGIAEFFRSGAGLGQRIYTWVFDLVTRLLKRIPDLSLFLLTAVLSGFMLSAKLPWLRQFYDRKLPKKWRSRCNLIAERMKDTLGSWCKAQLKLMGLCALVLTLGFLVLGVNYPLLFGTGIALLDALPALGTGLILVPWGLLAFLQGNSFLGIGLILLFGAASLLRAALEPRMLGKQMGLDPLLTLLSLYAGYRFLGLWGMILFPIAAITVKQFWKTDQ